MDIVILLPLLVTLAGIYLIIKLRFFYIFHPIRTMRCLLSSLSDSSSRTSLALALAGTLGVGNIVGVALGILIGGCGSIFWLFFSAVFAIVLKYCEAVLVADSGRSLQGSMIHVIKNSFVKYGSVFAYIYALLCLLLSFVMGASLQSASAIYFSGQVLGLDVKFLGIMFTLAVFLGVLGGVKKIEKITVFIIPLSTIIYIFLALMTILYNFSEVPDALVRIMNDAFSVRSALGGCCGFSIAIKMREGYARGILSNEAGAGTSSMAHSRSGADSVNIGLCGIIEVIFDTLILCTLTGLAVVVAVPDLSLYSSGVELILDSIGAVFGNLSRYLMLLCVLSFAYSTVICWYYYGEECYAYLFGIRKWIFFVIYIAFVLSGSFVSLDFFVYAADYLLLFLSILSTTTVIKNSDRIVHLSENFGLISPRH